jgi:hypothetical protein
LQQLASALVAGGILFVLTDSVPFAAALTASTAVASVDDVGVPVTVARGAFGVTLLVLAVLGWRGPMARPLVVALALGGGWFCLDAVHRHRVDVDDDSPVGGRPTGATGWRALAVLGGRCGGSHGRCDRARGS